MVAEAFNRLNQTTTASWFNRLNWRDVRALFNRLNVTDAAAAGRAVVVAFNRLNRVQEAVAELARTLPSTVSCMIVSDSVCQKLCIVCSIRRFFERKDALKALS